MCEEQTVEVLEEQRRGALLKYAKAALHNCLMCDFSIFGCREKYIDSARKKKRKTVPASVEA